MTHEQYGPPFTAHILHLAQALLLELGVSHRQDLVHNEDVRFEVGRDGERQPNVHPR